MPAWLDTILSDPSTTLATTNIQTAPGAAVQAVALPLMRAILPKVAERASTRVDKAQRLESLVGKPMVAALLKRYPRTLGRLGKIQAWDFSPNPDMTDLRQARGEYHNVGPGRNKLGDVRIRFDRQAPDALDQAQHLFSHEAFGHGPQDILGQLGEKYEQQMANAQLGDYVDPWLRETIYKLNVNPQFRRRAIPDLAERARHLSNLGQVRYESAPLELAANMRSLKLRDLARQEALEQAGEPYIPGLGPRENIARVNRFRTDLLKRKLQQFQVSNVRDVQPLDRAGEQELLDIVYRINPGLHHYKDINLFR